MKKILLTLLLIGDMVSTEVIHTAPKVRTYDANNELSDDVVKMVSITFRANSTALNKDHIGVLIPARNNFLGYLIYRGVILGTTSNNDGHMCSFPT